MDQLLYSRRLAASLVVGLGLAAGCATAVSAPSEQEQGSARVVHDPGRREVVITVGPIPVHAGGDHHEHHRSYSYAVSLPVAGWLRSYESTVVDAAGRRLPDEMLHHLNLILPDERELFTPIMRRLAAAGHETGRIRTPFRVGYPVQAGDSLLVVAMLHNPTVLAIEQAYVQVRLGYTPASTWLPMLSLYPFYLDVVMEPGPRSFDLPPGRSEVSWEGQPAVPGRIVGVGGHLHEHAVLLRFEDVTAGRVIWEARPQLDASGQVVGMPVTLFLRRLGVPLRPEHTYRLTAIYDNPTGDTIPNGGMGVLGGGFVPSRRAAWPQVNRQDPMYALDRQITISGFASRYGREEEHGGQAEHRDEHEPATADGHQHGHQHSNH